MNVNREELRQAAGFFNGEGSIHYNSFNRQIEVRITQRDWGKLIDDTLIQFDDSTGNLGKFNRRKALSRVNKAWSITTEYWVCNFEKAQAIIAMLWPFLSIRKRQQAINVLQQYHSSDAKRRPPYRERTLG